MHNSTRSKSEPADTEPGCRGSRQGKRDKRRSIQSRKSASLSIAFILTLFCVPVGALQAAAPCASPFSCIGMVIDSGDPVLIQMGHEMSGMVTDQEAGTVVKPTAGPIANVARMMSRENAALSVVPSDMLQYTNRSDDARLRKAEQRLRFIMTIGQKVVHVIAKKEIKGLEDLAGKRVVMGPDNTAIWVVSNNILHLHGVTPSERIQLKPVAGIAAVMSDEADAAFVVGDAPMGVVQKISEMRQNEDLKAQADNIHMLEIDFPLKGTGYRQVTVSYPGFAENVDTVAILPTLVSYDFTHKSSPYFKRRCRELAKIGETVRVRLEELRESGHKQWNATKWELEAGNWQKDECFFGIASEKLVSKSRMRDDVLEAQKILNQLGYNSGPEDGIMGPMTAGALKRFQEDRNLQPDGKLNTDLLVMLKGQKET